jgi:hypothetical protein
LILVVQGFNRFKGSRVLVQRFKGFKEFRRFNAGSMQVQCRFNAGSGHRTC